MVDLGFRGVDADNPGVEIIHRGKFKSMTNQQRRWLKRRQAVEPAIGHLKSDHRMNRCWLSGAIGDALHTVLCAAGYNLRWLLRAITSGRIKPLFLAFMLWCLNRMRDAATLRPSSPTTNQHLTRQTHLGQWSSSGGAPAATRISHGRLLTP